MLLHTKIQQICGTVGKCRFGDVQCPVTLEHPRSSSVNAFIFSHALGQAMNFSLRMSQFSVPFLLCSSFYSVLQSTPPEFWNLENFPTMQHIKKTVHKKNLDTAISRIFEGVYNYTHSLEFVEWRKMQEETEQNCCKQPMICAVYKIQTHKNRTI